MVVVDDMVDISPQPRSVRKDDIIAVCDVKFFFVEIEPPIPEPSAIRERNGRRWIAARIGLSP